MADKSRYLAVTPQQRWHMWLLLRHRDRKIGGKGKGGGAAGRRERRLHRALGIDVLRAVLLEYDDHINAEYAKSRDPHLFEVGAEVVDQLAELMDLERHPTVDLVLGDLWDQVDELKSERGEHKPPDAPGFVDDASSWAPRDEDDAEAIVRSLAGRVDAETARAILLEALELLPEPKA